MSGAIAMQSSDKQWQAECDARTLLEAAQIKADKNRHRAAVKQLKAMRDEAAKVVEAQGSKGRR